MGGLKNSKMLTDAYGGVGGGVKKLGNAYGCLRWNKCVGRPKTPKYLLMRCVIIRFVPPPIRKLDK